MSRPRSRTGCWRPWLAWLLLWGGLYAPSSSAALATLDSLRPLAQHVERLSAHDLAASLELSAGILRRHNARRESPALAAYVEQLDVVLARDCCDFFTALPAVRRLTETLTEVLALQLPSPLQPVVRRSFVCAVWLLQRSRFFRWDNAAMHHAAMSGFYKLYEAHLDAAAGRPISFHHISKTGGTSLCNIAWANGCRGPGMSKTQNCLLDPALDGPIWVLRHDVVASNRIAQPVPPPPPPLPPAAGIEDEDRLLVRRLTARPRRKQSFDWFMYECPPARLAGKVGRPCSERQEAATGKLATFFAIENALPEVRAGIPQVCEAFTNVVIVRDALTEATSLMAEVSLVYSRLLRQSRVVGWAPPKWDLAWWHQWAPVVISSYATRTLLGPGAYCPAAAAAGGGGPGARRTLSSSGGPGDGGPGAGGLPPLGASEVQAALHALYAFDVVLELGSLELMDLSLAKLLGWVGRMYSEARLRRPAPQLQAPSWQLLELLAKQQPPPEDSDAQELRQGRGARAPDAAHQPQPGASPAAEVDGVSLDAVARMIGERLVRQAYAGHGRPTIVLPLRPSMQLPAPPPGAVRDALAALRELNTSRITAASAEDSAPGEHMLVSLQPPAQAGGAAASRLPAPARAAAELFHVWPKHGVVLDEQQFAELQASIAPDRLLYEHGRVLQLLDAAWVSSLLQQRRVRRMLAQLQREEEEERVCGFAGLNHLQ